MKNRLIAHQVVDEGPMGVRIVIDVDGSLRPPQACPGCGGWKLDSKEADRFNPRSRWWTRVKGQIGSSLLHASRYRADGLPALGPSIEIDLDHDHIVAVRNLDDPRTYSVPLPR